MYPTLFQGHVRGKIWVIKLLTMTLQKALRTSLTAFLLSAFLLSPLQSNEAATANRKRTFSIQAQANDGSSDQAIKLDFSLPVNNKKGKETDHNPDLIRHKRHADEDRHELHHHHFDRNKSRRRLINMITSFFLKIIIVISYFSILLCSYMSLCH